MGYGKQGRASLRRSGIVLAVSASVALLGSGAASASLINLTTTADGAVSDGTGSVIAFNNLQTITATAFNGAANSFGVFEFDLSGISDTDTINSATFAFTLATNAISTASTIPFIVEAYLGDGVIDTGDFTALGAQVASGAISATGSTQALAGDTLSFVLTDVSVLQSALAGNLLTLRIASTVIFNQIQIAAIEHPFNAATLAIDAQPMTPVNDVPLPAGLPLMLSGLAALGCAGRKKTRKLPA